MRVRTYRPAILSRVREFGAVITTSYSSSQLRRIEVRITPTVQLVLQIREDDDVGARYF